MRALPLLLIVAGGLTAALPASARDAGPAPPTKKEARALLRPAPPVPRVSVRVSHVLADLGGGRFPVLGVRTERRTAEDIADEEESWDHWSGEYAQAYVRPFVAVVERGPDGRLSVAGSTDLPLEVVVSSGQSLTLVHNAW